MKRLLIIVPLLCMGACSVKVGDVVPSGEDAAIYPDYKGVVVPDNIAPLNFSYLGSDPCVLQIEDAALFKARKGLFKIGRRYWKKLLLSSDSIRFTLFIRSEEGWRPLEPFFIYVSHDRIDPYLSYRLIPPGYQGWESMGIYQRNLESYRQSPVYENKSGGRNCCNCHTYLERDPSTLIFHARAAFGGTIVAEGGRIEKLNTKTDSTISALVYPYWHPDGDVVAFSTNKTFQQFYNHGDDRIEVYDDASDVVVYNLRTHSISWSPLIKSEDAFETFPAFSPDGKWLYFCSAEAVENVTRNYDKVHYGIKRIAFNAAEMSFGNELETVFDAPALGKSASFPRISPDGRFLCFTLHKYGNFSIWHQDADLWMLDLATGECRPLEELNSDSVESFHSWSSNGKWLVFSSRRDDGLYTRLYISHVDSEGNASKPFMVPQKDPVNYYRALAMSYNLPQFTTGRVSINRRRLIDTMRKSHGTDVQVSM